MIALVMLNKALGPQAVYPLCLLWPSANTVLLKSLETGKGFISSGFGDSIDVSHRCPHCSSQHESLLSDCSLPPGVKSCWKNVLMVYKRKRLITTMYLQAKALAQGQRVAKAGCSRNRVNRAVRMNGLGTVATNFQGGHMAHRSILGANCGHHRC